MIISTWRTRFENPTVIAATVASLTTLAITIVTGGSGVLEAYIRSNAETQRAIRAEKLALTTSILDQIPRDNRLKNFIDLGLLPDENCKMRQVILGYTQDCKPKQN